MKIQLKRQNQAVHFLATNATGNEVNIDGGPTSDGENKGARPMELLLMGIAGCSSIDIHLILKKMRQQVDDLQIEVEGQRAEDEVPKVFKKIHITFDFKGDLKEGKVRRAIDLSMEKYCSVSKMLEKTAEITYQFSINGEQF